MGIAELVLDIDILRDNGGWTETIALLDNGGHNAIAGADPVQGCTTDLAPAVVPPTPIVTGSADIRAWSAHIATSAPTNSTRT